VDVIISNCVINLCVDKGAVFKDIWRVLKQGGELYFSDVYSDARIPEYLRKDATLWGECLSGALFIDDFKQIMTDIGFKDFRIVKESEITINNKEVEMMLTGIQFYSYTIRAFKLDGLEDERKDYG